MFPDDHRYWSQYLGGSLWRETSFVESCVVGSLIAVPWWLVFGEISVFGGNVFGGNLVTVRWWERFENVWWDF